MYALLPPLLAPIVVENIKFKGSEGNQPDFLQEGQGILCFDNSSSSDKLSSESGLLCTSSNK
tara:strand:+ start:2047 stop:2232 length:186 start_codon:yes stop_codon:yes gene_type:complete